MHCLRCCFSCTTQLLLWNYFEIALKLPFEDTIICCNVNIDCSNFSSSQVARLTTVVEPQFSFKNNHSNMGILTTSLVLGATTGFLWVLRKWRESQWQGITTVERLDGKVVVLTGATSGLGKATAEDLASRGATIVLACRNVEAAQEVVNTIKLKYPDVEMVQVLFVSVSFTFNHLFLFFPSQGVVELDLSSLESVKKCAANILEKYPQINILINNAGVSVPPAKGIKTIDGYEINFGVNHLGHFLLTNLLLDRIKESRPSR